MLYKFFLHICLWHLHYEIARNKEREILVREAITYDEKRIKGIEMELIQTA